MFDLAPIRRLIFGLSLDETSFHRRGFTSVEAAVMLLVGFHEDFLRHVFGVCELTRDAPGAPVNTGAAAPNNGVPICSQSYLRKLDGVFSNI
jgi:hypothetical protein